MSQCDAAGVVYPRAVVYDSPSDVLHTGSHYRTHTLLFSHPMAETCPGNVLTPFLASSSLPSGTMAFQHGKAMSEVHRSAMWNETEHRDTAACVVGEQNENGVSVESSIPALPSSSVVASPSSFSISPPFHHVTFKHRVVVHTYSLEEDIVSDKQKTLPIQKEENSVVSSPSVIAAVEDEKEDRDDTVPSCGVAVTPEAPRPSSKRRRLTLVQKTSGPKWGKEEHCGTLAAMERTEEKTGNAATTSFPMAFGLEMGAPLTMTSSTDEVEDVGECRTTTGALEKGSRGDTYKRERNGEGDEEEAKGPYRIAKGALAVGEVFRFIPFRATLHHQDTEITLPFLEQLCKEEVREAEKMAFVEEHREAEALLQRVKSYLHEIVPPHG